MDSKYTLYFEGLCAYLVKPNDFTEYEFQACTHGGWAVYACYTNGMADYTEVVAALIDKSDIKDFCKKFCKKNGYGLIIQ